MALRAFRRRGQLGCGQDLQQRQASPVYGYSHAVVDAAGTRNAPCREATKILPGTVSVLADTVTIGQHDATDESGLPACAHLKRETCSDVLCWLRRIRDAAAPRNFFGLGARSIFACPSDPGSAIVLNSPHASRIYQEIDEITLKQL
jgi:hypothetical protein